MFLILVQRESLPVDIDTFLNAAIRDREHDAYADRDSHSNQGPSRADSLKNAQLPKRRENTRDKDNITNQINTCPSHD